MRKDQCPSGYCWILWTRIGLGSFQNIHSLQLHIGDDLVCTTQNLSIACYSDKLPFASRRRFMLSQLGVSLCSVNTLQLQTPLQSIVDTWATRWKHEFSAHRYCPQHHFIEVLLKSTNYSSLLLEKYECQVACKQINGSQVLTR